VVYIINHVYPEYYVPLLDEYAAFPHVCPKEPSGGYVLLLFHFLLSCSGVAEEGPADIVFDRVAGSFLGMGDHQLLVHDRAT
jgi:hypothetical protein